MFAPNARLLTLTPAHVSGTTSLLLLLYLFTKNITDLTMPPFLSSHSVTFSSLITCLTSTPSTNIQSLHFEL